LHLFAVDQGTAEPGGGTRVVISTGKKKPTAEYGAVKCHCAFLGGSTMTQSLIIFTAILAVSIGILLTFVGLETRTDKERREARIPIEKRKLLRGRRAQSRHARSRLEQRNVHRVGLKEKVQRRARR
jgi:hypothetical protein